MEAGTISLYRHKTNTESVIYMKNRVKEVLRKRDKTTDKVFMTTCSMVIRDAIKKAGLKVFRHTCATRLIRNGLSLYEVSVMLGHRNPATTVRYAHLENTRVTAKAAQLLNGLNK